MVKTMYRKIKATTVLPGFIVLSALRASAGSHSELARAQTVNI